MRDRIIALLNDKKLTAIKFAELMEVQPSSISHIISGRNNPSFDFIAKLLGKFDDINPDWIILGKGDMHRDLLKNKVPEIISTPVKPPASTPIKPIKSAELAILEEDNDKSDTNTPIPDLRSVNSDIAKIIVLYKDGSFEYFTHK